MKKQFILLVLLYVQSYLFAQTQMFNNFYDYPVWQSGDFFGIYCNDIEFDDSCNVYVCGTEDMVGMGGEQLFPFIAVNGGAKNMLTPPQYNNYYSGNSYYSSIDLKVSGNGNQAYLGYYTDSCGYSSTFTEGYTTQCGNPFSASISDVLPTVNVGEHYMAGSFVDSVYFNSSLHLAQSDTNGYILKFVSNTTMQSAWVLPHAPVSWLASTASHAIVAMGKLRDTCSMNGFTIAPTDTNNLFFANMSNGGVCNALSILGKGTFSGIKSKVGYNGEIYIVGIYRDSCTIGGTSIMGTTGGGMGGGGSSFLPGQSVFFAQLDSMGNVISATHLYATGTYTSTYNNELNYCIDKSGNGYVLHDNKLRKYNSAGSLVWMKTNMYNNNTGTCMAPSTSSYWNIYGIEVNPEGNIGVVGAYNPWYNLAINGTTFIGCSGYTYSIQNGFAALAWNYAPCVTLQADFTTYNADECLPYMGFTSTSTGMPTSWYWDFGDPASGAANTSTAMNPIHLYPSNFTTYTVTLIVSDGNTSDTVIQSVTSFAALPSVISASPDPALICPGDSIVLALSSYINGYSFDNIYWQDPNGNIISNTYTTPPVPIGSYYIVIETDAPSGSGTFCTNDGYINVLDASLPPPIITVNGNWLQSTATDSIQWYKDGVLIPGANNADYMPTITGCYSVSSTMTSAPFCTTFSDTCTYFGTTAVLNAIFTYNSNPCNGSISFNDASLGVPITWLWDFGDPSSGTANTSTLQNPTHTFIGGTGSYTITLTVFDGTNTSTFTQTVNTSALLPLAISFNPANPILCSGSTIVLGTNNIPTTSGGNPTAVLWQDLSTNVNVTNYSSSNPHSSIAVGIGSYLCQVSVANPTGGICVLTDTITVQDNSLPAPIIASNGTTLQTNSAGALQWYENGLIIPGATGSTYSPSVSGCYSVAASTLTAPFCTTFSDTCMPTTISISAKFSAAIDVCKPFVAFTDNSLGGPTTWLWDFGDPASGAANTSTLQNPTHIFSANTGTYTVSLTVSDGISTKDTTQTLNINAIFPLQITFNPSNPIVCIGDSLVLSTVNVPANNGNNTTYAIWYDFATNTDWTDYTSALPYTSKALPAGTYNYQASVANGLGGYCHLDTNITIQSINQSVPTITLNGNTLQTNATGNIQWYQNGVAINGATATSYTPTATACYMVSSTTTTPPICTVYADTCVYVMVTDILEIENRHITIFPNPTEDIVNIYSKIAIPIHTHIELTDISGKSISIITVAQSNREVPISLDNISKGIYLLKITIPNQRPVFFKLIKK